MEVVAICPLGEVEAVVILFGWLGAEPRHLQKYANLYHERNCGTVSAIARAMPLMMRNNRSLKKIASKAAEEAVRMIRRTEISRKKTIPVILHVFSNGGAILLEILENKISQTFAEHEQELESIRDGHEDISLEDLNEGQIETKSQSGAVSLSTSFFNSFTPLIKMKSIRSVSSAEAPTNGKNEEALANDKNEEAPNSGKLVSSEKHRWWKLNRKENDAMSDMSNTSALHESFSEKDFVILGERLKIGCQIFDSAPCYPSTGIACRAVGQAITHPFQRLLVKSVHLVISSWRENIKKRLRLRSADDFWRHFQESKVASKQVFIYSASDKITDHRKLDELVEYRKNKGILVKTLKLNDSPHVQHLRYYTAEYEGMIDHVLDTICTRDTNADTDWWSDSDDEEECSMLGKMKRMNSFHHV